MLYNCPYCHHQHATIYRSNQKLSNSEPRDIYRCSECSSLYPYPRMDELDIENYMAIHESDDLQFDANLNEPTRYEEFLCTLLKSHMEVTGNALDIGAFTGRFCRILNAIGFDAYGLEPQSNACAFARTNGLKVFEGYFPEKLPSFLLKNKYKVISMMEIIYYLVDLKKSLLLVKSMLDSEGFLLIKCHQGKSRYYNNPDNSCFKRYGDYVQAIPLHSSINYCLQDAGFNVVYLEPMPRLFSKLDGILGKRFGSAVCKKFERIFNRWRNRFITDIESADRLIVLAQKKEEE
jgi:SAM-dependent methyltransferase